MRIYRPSKQLKVLPIYNKLVLLRHLNILPNDSSDIVNVIRDGMDTSVIDNLKKELGLTQKNLLHYISLTSSTLRRRHYNNNRLTPFESDRIYRVVMIYRSALELFSGDTKAG
ncbi:MAG: hypothetical protein QM504_07785 [Pseudomonadota bacterium]